MQLFPFLKGLGLGFLIAAPVGPIGLLCIRRTLAEGRTSGLLTGLGAASADAFYGAVAAFGLTALSHFLVGQQLLIRLVGGVFLCYLGLRTLTAPVQPAPADRQGRTAPAAFVSTFFLTLTNPMTIISFAAVFAGLGIGARGEDYLAAVLLVAGVFLGSAAWWFLLSGGVSLLRTRFNATGMQWVNRIAGILILLFGGAAILAAIR